MSPPPRIRPPRIAPLSSAPDPPRAPLSRALIHARAPLSRALIHVRAPLSTLLLLLILLPTTSSAEGPLQKGIALGLFAEDPGFSYAPLLKEIRATGATHVSLVVPYYQYDIRSVRIGPHPRFSPQPGVLTRTVKEARAMGLKVFLFPILRLEYAATPDEWRGALRPHDPDAWWASYTEFILQMARVAARHGVSALCVGSELSAMDTRPERWTPLIARARKIFRGQLVYSANWDHYDKVGIWHLVDLAGLSAYFPLIGGDEKPTLHRLIHAWREQRVRISRWRARIGKPLLFTELGYHSQARTSSTPWDEAADKPVSLEEQALCYQAFMRVWRGTSYLRGVYFWTWFGWGGPRSREYTPRGKPAARVICQWFGAAKGACPSAWGMPWFKR